MDYYGGDAYFDANLELPPLVVLLVEVGRLWQISKFVMMFFSKNK